MTRRVLWHVAFDDTDSLKGMCTTYLATVITWKLTEMNAILVDYPRLIRHNPNIPKKTRGNGAVAISALVPWKVIKSVEKEIISLIEEYSHVDVDANPSVIFLEGENTLADFDQIIARIGSEVVSPQEITSILERLRTENRLNIRYHCWGTKDGIVGAFGAMFQPLVGRDYTFELLVYRPPRLTRRTRDYPSYHFVKRLEEDFPTTLMNVDPRHQVVLMFPHGPDPVICGIRGTNPEDLLKFWLRLQNRTPLETMMLFRTNQHVDAHVKSFLRLYPLEKNLMQARPHEVIVRTVIIESNPITVPGRHVFVLARDDSGSYCWLAAYEPTKQFRDVVRRLTSGDVIRVVGSIRRTPENMMRRLLVLVRDENLLLEHSPPSSIVTVNLEEFAVISLAIREQVINPRCPTCGKTLTSAGKGKGFKCKRCHQKFPSSTRLRRRVPRLLVEGRIYQTPPIAMRHVNRPKNVHLFRPPICPPPPNQSWMRCVQQYLQIMSRIIKTSVQKKQKN